MGFNEKGEIIRGKAPRPPAVYAVAGAVGMLLVIGVLQWLSSSPPVPPVNPAPVVSTPVPAPAWKAAPRRSVSERAADYSLATGSILPQHMYDLLAHMSGGDFIPVSFLYDEDNEPQEAAVRKAFSDKNGRLYNRVTREQAYEFVRQHFDLRAIRQLGGKKPSPNDDIDQFIRDNHDILRGVTKALYEGHFSVYSRGLGDPASRDFEIIFKSFGRPDLTDPLARSTITYLQKNGHFPTAKYAR